MLQFNQYANKSACAMRRKYGINNYFVFFVWGWGGLLPCRGIASLSLCGKSECPCFWDMLRCTCQTLWYRERMWVPVSEYDVSKLYFCVCAHQSTKPQSMTQGLYLRAIGKGQLYLQACQFSAVIIDTDA